MKPWIVSFLESFHKSSPGFETNRVMFFYDSEALHHRTSEQNRKRTRNDPEKKQYRGVLHRTRIPSGTFKKTVELKQFNVRIIFLLITDSSTHTVLFYWNPKSSETWPHCN